MSEEQNEIKRLYRSRHEKMIAGVCGGIAEYFNVDPTLVRVVWAILIFFGGIGLLMYIAALIIIPESPLGEEEEEEKKASGGDKALFWGSALVIVGILLLLRQLGIFYYFHFWDLPWQMIWAVFLILVGVFLLYNRLPLERYGFSGSKREDKGDVPLMDGQVYRSRKNRMISGVCGGLAEYFDVDATLVRLAWVFLTLASVGIGIIAYVVMIIVFPEMPETESSPMERK